MTIITSLFSSSDTGTALARRNRHAIKKTGTNTRSILVTKLKFDVDLIAARISWSPNNGVEHYEVQLLFYRHDQWV